MMMMKSLPFLAWCVATASSSTAAAAATITEDCHNNRICQDAASSSLKLTTGSSVTDSSGATESRLRVHIPYDLHVSDGDEHIKADYGYESSKSGSIAAFVYYVESSLCHGHAWDNNSTTTTGEWPSHQGGKKSPFIIMTKLDFDCHSVVQVRNAQFQGAAAVVFADPKCRCQDVNCTAAFGQPDCYNEEYHLTTDGSSLDVSIPSVLLFRSKAETIIQRLKKDQAVLMELTWGIPHMNQEAGAQKQVGPVHAELWMTAHDPIAELSTIQEFAALSQHFAEAAVVAPRFALIDGARFGCDHQVDDGGPCDHLCTNHGRYCALQSSNDIPGNVVVRETLRRLCIWQHYGDYRDEAAKPNDKESTTHVYWDYLAYHRENCYSKEEFNRDECIEKAYNTAGIDENTIKTCMSESGDMDTNVANTILDTTLKRQRHDGVVAVPSIVVDRKALDSHSSYRLFYAICDPFFEAAGYAKVPDLCEKCWDCTNVMGCITNGGKCTHQDYSKEHNTKKESTGSSDRKRNHPFLRFLGWMIFLGLLGGAGYHVYQTRFNVGGGYGSGDGRGGAFYTQLVGGSD